MNRRTGVEAGKIWVEQKLREISARLRNPFQALEWQRPEQRTKQQFARDSIGLRIYWGEEFRIIEFLVTDLRDAEATPEIQARLEEMIRERLVT